MDYWPSSQLRRLALAAKKKGQSQVMIPILLSSSIPASLAIATTQIATWRLDSQ